MIYLPIVNSLIPLMLMDLESSINLFLWQKLEEISDAAWDVCCLLLRRYIYIFMVGICFNGLKIVLFFALGLVLMNQEAFSSRVSLVAAHSVVPVYIYIPPLCFASLTTLMDNHLANANKTNTEKSSPRHGNLLRKVMFAKSPLRKPTPHLMDGRVDLSLLVRIFPSAH